MGATAAMIAEIRRMVDEPGITVYTDALITGFIERYPLMDALGTNPLEVDSSTEPPTLSEKDNWIPTYDLHAAAAIIWEEKAAAVAENFDFQADGGNYTRSQKYEQYMSKARWHTSRRSAKTIRMFVEPRLEMTEESNSD